MKKLKQRFELVGRLLLILATLFTNFAGIMPVLARDLGYTKGEVIDSVNSDGNIVSQGDAMITKTVRKTDEDGVYQIDLSVKGKDKVTSESQTASIYAAVVLDNSGSMDNCFLCIFSDNKYKNAKEGTQSFAKTLLSKYSSSQLALVTFSTNARVTREFENKNFDNTDFPRPKGLTYLSDGINTAKGLLDDKKKADSNAKLYMVILTDGYPEESDITGDEAANKAKLSARDAKNAGIEIFTIGYGTNKSTADLLKNIATDSKHFSEADEQSVADKFNDIAGSIDVRVPAGTNATLTDVIGNEFTYVEGSKSSNDITVNGKNVTVNVGDVTETGNNYSFKVRINKDAKDGLHETNASCKLEYKNVDGNNDSLELNDSAKVYWEAQRYPYTINYYKNSVSSENYINNVEGSAVLNTEIKLSDIELNKYKPAGYKDGIVKTTLPYVIKDGTNVINIVYEVRDDLSYVIEYYKETDDNSEEKISDDKDNTVNNVRFEEKIDLTKDILNKYKEGLGFGYKDGSSKDLPYTIKEEGNVIKVCYERRRDMSYTVKYLEKDTDTSLYDDKEVTNKTYNETYEEEAKEAPYGYKLVGDKKQSIKLDEEDKVIIFYYKKIKANYIVRYVEEGTNNEVAPSVKKEGNLVDPVEEEAIEVRGYKLVGDDKVTVELNSQEETEIIFYYEKIKVNYTIKYLDNTTKEEIMASVNKDGLFFDKVTEKAPSIEGYKLASLDEITIELNEDNNEIVFYYDKVVQVVKTGVHENNNDYILFVALLGSLTALGYSLKKRFN